MLVSISPRDEIVTSEEAAANPRPRTCSERRSSNT